MNTQYELSVDDDDDVAAVAAAYDDETAHSNRLNRG